jgi:DNA-binding MarR family transcriptional regulator
MERPETQGLAIRELAIVHQLSSTRLNRALRPLGVTLTHTAVLSHLARVPQGCSVGEIAAAMEVNQPAVSKTLRTLIDLGAVTAEVAEGDSRRREIRLTGRGGQLLTEAMMAMHPDATVAFAGLSDERLGLLVELLAEVRVRLDDTRGDGV